MLKAFLNLKRSQYLPTLRTVHSRREAEPVRLHSNAGWLPPPDLHESFPPPGWVFPH